MKKDLQYWLFDLDNTLYPLSSGLFRAIDDRINLYLREYLDIDGDRADRLRRSYFEKYGITLVGLMEEKGVDPHHYMEFVHAVPVTDYLRPSLPLRRILEAIPTPKGIYTNGSRRHSMAVTGALGVNELFTDIFDIASVDFIPKPDPRSYRTVLEQLGVSGSQVVLVEDLEKNLAPARDLGMTTIFINEGGRKGNADYSLPLLEKLPELFPALGYTMWG